MPEPMGFNMFSHFPNCVGPSAYAEDSWPFLIQRPVGVTFLL